MKAEKIVLSLVGLCIGLLVAGGVFVLYKFTQNPKNQSTNQISSQTTPSPSSTVSDIFKVDKPADEAVLDSRTLTISGKTEPNAIVVANSESTDQVGKATTNGDYSFTVTIPDGTSFLKITTILANGEEKTITRTVTYSSESF